MIPIFRLMKPMFNILPIFICFVIVLGASILPAAAEPPAAKEPFKLPGLVINAEKRCVDVDATVCLEQGALELIACTKDSKEHESVVVVEALPVHIHTALLLLGARNGNPAMRRPINKEQTLWADVPPRGDPIDVFLEFKDAEGKAVERPIGDFIDKHPTLKMLALSFLMMIGLTLIVEGFDVHVPKGYIYFAMAFSVFVEVMNIQLRKRLHAKTPRH